MIPASATPGIEVANNDRLRVAFGPDARFDRSTLRRKSSIRRVTATKGLSGKFSALPYRSDFMARTLRQAQALVERKERFFGLATLGVDFEGSAEHSNLLADYDKLFTSTAGA